MSNRIFVGLRASNVLRRSFLLTTSRREPSLQSFSTVVARGKAAKIRTPFSGPQPDTLTGPVTNVSRKELEKDGQLSSQSIETTGDPSLKDQSLISLQKTEPFPNQDLSSTRPAKLDSPPAPQPDEYGGTVPIRVRLPYLYNLGKAYVSFYKSGLKNIWHNYKEYRELNKRLGSYYINDVVKYGGKNGLPTISRREYQLYLRTRHDIRKLIPFSIILLICGEFTPLVVLAFGSAVVPSTCRIPRQVDSDRLKLRKRENKVRDAGPVGNARLDQKIPARVLAEWEARIGYVWGLLPSPRPLPLLHFLLRGRVRRRAEELVCNAILVRREGGIAQLNPAEAIDFAKQMSDTLFLWVMRSQTRRPGMAQVTPERVKWLMVPYFDRYIDRTLEILRYVERDPRKHYFAGLRCY